MFYLVVNQRRMLFDLINADFKNRYLGHHLGVVWALLQPLIMVAIYWFVFSIGFGIKSISNTSFLLWLLSGMVPWLFLNDAILQASNAICSQSFLVKKIKFEVRFLPLVKIGSALFVNAWFWVFLLVVCLLQGHAPSMIWLQLVYYIVAMLAITMALSMLFSALMPFVHDVGQVLTILFQMLFWLTPVTWNRHVLPSVWQPIIDLNPFAYIINGVRDTLIDQVPFWHHPQTTVYFWGFTLGFYMISHRAFNKLSPHFADVL